MGRIVYAAAMSHVLYPDYYGENVGPHGRKMVEELIDIVRDMGRTLSAAAPDALVVVADDHLNVFSFDAVPALCVRIGRFVNRMVQDDAIEFDRALDGLPERYPVHEDLANAILEQGLRAGFDFAASWSAPLDHAFLSPVSTLYGDRSVPPLVPFWVNCFVAPQPTAQRCFAAGRHIARVVADGPWKVAIIATGGPSHFPELSLARVGQSDPVFDRCMVKLTEAGDHAALAAPNLRSPRLRGRSRGNADRRNAGRTDAHQRPPDDGAAAGRRTGAARGDGTPPWNRPRPPGEHYQVVVHVDAPALADPDAPGQSVLESGEHVSAETSRRLACDASRVVMRNARDSRVVEVAARTRTIPPALRRALHHRDRSCRFPGCYVRFGQGHHIRHWAQGGPTTLSNLTMLCRRHHRAVHEEGYQLTRLPDGELQFRRPDGGVFPEVPPPIVISYDALRVLRARNKAAGLILHSHTLTPGWLGERLDVGYAIDVLHPLARREALTSPIGGSS